MSKFLSKALQGDRVVWIIFVALFFISTLEMFSASSMLVHKTGSVQGPILRHVMFYGIGAVALLCVQVFDFKRIRIFGYAGLVCSFLCLIYAMLGFGVEQANAARWIEIGGWQFQPSEVAKLSLIVVVADMVERFQNEELQNKGYIYLALTIIAICGIIFLENFSTAALLFITVMIMMWIGEIKWKKIVATIGVVFACVVFVLLMALVIPEEVYSQNETKFLKLFERAYTWTARFENFAESADDTVNKFTTNDGNFQENHAQMAIARGAFPKGPGSSVESNYLPEAYSDFIFAIIVEELGALFAMFVIFLYLWLLYRAGKVARQSDSLFCAILVIGITTIMVLQAFIHIAVSVHLIPVTGQPLPLISRGGTSILVNCVYFGIIISVTRYIQQQQLRKQMATQEAKEEPTKVDIPQETELIEEV